jgi:hypothetical protein
LVEPALVAPLVESALHASLVETALHASVDSLDPFEEHKHFCLADPAVAVGVALLHCCPGVLVAVGRSHTHLQTEFLVSVEELLALELSIAVLVIFLVDHLNLGLKHLVVIVPPSSRVVDMLESVHLLMTVAVGAPAVETLLSLHAELPSHSLLALHTKLSLPSHSLLALHTKLSLPSHSSLLSELSSHSLLLSELSSHSSLLTELSSHSSLLTELSSHSSLLSELSSHSLLPSHSLLSSHSELYSHASLHVGAHAALEALLSLYALLSLEAS